MMRASSRAAHGILVGIMGLGIGAGTLPLTGCGSFFVCQKASCPTTGTGTTGTGDYVYVSNGASGVTYVSAYQIGTGSLTAISGSPYNLSYVPVAMAVSPNDAFLYVAASPGTSYSGLYAYPLSTTTGAVSSGSAISTANISSMTISPDGNFLFTLDSTTGAILTQYTLNTSTGAITGSTTFSTPGGPTGVGCPVSSATPASATCAVAVSPQGSFVAVSLGTNGTVVFPYSSTAGISNANYTVAINPVAGTGDYSLAFDDSGFLYIAATASITPYGALGTTSPTTGTSLTYSSNAVVPRSVTLSTGYTYLYTADEGSSQISAFSVSAGALTQLTGSPITAPANVSALAAERSGSYLLAAGYGSTGLQLFPITSTGLSASVASQATGTATTIPVVMAVTH